VEPSGFTYDAAGNMTNAGSGLMTYDAETRMTNAAGVTYTYDGDGKRVKKSNGKLYWYGPDGEVQAESDLAGVWTIEHMYFNGKRVARRELVPAYSLRYHFSDHLGSASVITNGYSGTILDESDYYPFGGERVITNSDPNQYKFTGKERDGESGLDYFGARHYGGNFGRFLQADQPFADQDPTDPQSWNLYTYTRNNPLRYVDPNGQGAWDIFKGAAVGAANFVGNTVTATVQTAYALSPVGAATGATQQFVGGAIDYVATGISAYQENWGAGVADQLTAQGEQGAMEVVTEAVLTGGAAATIEVGATSGTSSRLGGRAQEIHGALDPIAQGKRTTAVAQTSEGQTLVATSSRTTLTPAQRSTLKPGETIAKGKVSTHAERKIVDAAKPGTVKQMAVTREPCPTCKTMLKDNKIKVEVTNK